MIEAFFCKINETDQKNFFAALKKTSKKLNGRPQKQFKTLFFMLYWKLEINKDS